MNNSILDIPMQINDAGAKTIREYLKALVSAVWTQQEGFSGKRPFGNSGWKWDLATALVQAGIVDAKLDEDGEIEYYSIDHLRELDMQVRKIINKAIIEEL